MRTSKTKIICDTGTISRKLTIPIFATIFDEIALKYDIYITTTIKIELYKWIYDYKSKLKPKEFNAFFTKHQFIASN